MPIINRIADFQPDMTEWRRHIHAHPETAFEEHQTAAFVAGKLESFGIEIHQGLAQTGVVGSLKGAHGDGPAIALRADMDALDILEKNEHDYASTNPGKMHACGHDGHTTMLLGAAKYLSETKNFAGTVHFVFQPAEEHAGGGREMVKDGLFDLFPAESVWGMHNFPGQDIGTFGVCVGPAMAAADTLDITITGQGTHAAFPHLGDDVMTAAAHLVTALQTVASRTIDPMESVVVSITQIHAGETYNIIPEEVILKGTVRSFKKEIQEQAREAVERVAAGIGTSFGVTVDVGYTYGYPATVNDVAESDFAVHVAADVVGPDNVFTDLAPKMGAEDFSFMLNEKPGCYIWIGNGSGEGGCYLHNPNYDFNDEALAIGASYWARLVEKRLEKQ
ncbi:MAG: amidohydrolase [Rhodospirillaceae bacterium]|jgi:hippurate hydrolase|nr:amidohydrolase [Rhodospirillaceae bacterium]MBT6431403.1 amidohydrolase [Rhodospirillaceae bacterium]MBT7758453.1 amidohydrolase [Rhodospirillaceae bacterium]